MATIQATADRRSDARPGALEPRGPARFIADPAAVGLAGFGLTTFALGMINVGALSTTALPVIFPLALAYGGIVQLLAGMWAFIRGDTFAAVAFSSYGGFWISFWALNAFFLKQIPAGEQGAALGLYLALWGFFTLWLWLASFRVNWAVNLVLLTLVAAYGLLAAGKTADSVTTYNIGGAFTLATAAIAWYVAAAVTINQTFGRNILPLGERRPVQQDVPGA
jgi:succinate-acetate transporter protein